MKIPKKIEKLLLKRQKLAENLAATSTELDQWLESKGADFTDPDICDSTITGCMIYCEPSNARESVEKYIQEKL